MTHVADYAAMAAIPVVVGVSRDGCSGLNADKASQQKQDKRGADPASGNAIWIGAAHRDSLSILDGTGRRRLRKPQIVCRTVRPHRYARFRTATARERPSRHAAEPLADRIRRAQLPNFAPIWTTWGSTGRRRFASDDHVSGSTGVLNLVSQTLTKVITHY